MIQIECSVAGAHYGNSRENSPQAYTIPNVKQQVSFSCLNAIESTPPRVTPLTSPAVAVPVTSASAVAIAGKTVTIGAFTATGTYAYRIDVGALFLLLELEVIEAE